jgi:hypothetical protein
MTTTSIEAISSLKVWETALQKGQAEAVDARSEAETASTTVRTGTRREVMGNP